MPFATLWGAAFLYPFKEGDNCLCLFNAQARAEGFPFGARFVLRVRGKQGVKCHVQIIIALHYRDQQRRQIVVEEFAARRETNERWRHTAIPVLNRYLRHIRPWNF